MKLVTCLLAAIVLLTGVAASHAVVRIGGDRGGLIGTYVHRYKGLRSSGQSVIIDGFVLHPALSFSAQSPRTKSA